ncbi:MAG: hypothetical protein BWZ01_02916 [Deltaproteobacteria bacterium ADurb.BinA179]|nr:MAG: hypothetical protein BWZ01_02916 [Deltaproteobacteria bacterium ADurb.BinA179]
MLRPEPACFSAFVTCQDLTPPVCKAIRTIGSGEGRGSCNPSPLTVITYLIKFIHIWRADGHPDQDIASPFFGRRSERAGFPDSRCLHEKACRMDCEPCRLRQDLARRELSPGPEYPLSLVPGRQRRRGHRRFLLSHGACRQKGCPEPQKTPALPDSRIPHGHPGVRPEILRGALPEAQAPLCHRPGQLPGNPRRLRPPRDREHSPVLLA